MPSRSPLTRIFFSPEAEDDLFYLHAKDDDLQAIREQLSLLAQNPGLAYPILFQDPFLSPSQRLHRYDVGRFQLNCKFDFDARELEVVSVEM
jgi:mRNA-degrading endonuclease RelE of RelBE toxin-antitoxin system